MRIFVRRYPAAHVVIGQRLQFVRFSKAIERNGGAGGARQFLLGTIGLHVEVISGSPGCALRDLVLVDVVAQRAQFIDLEVFDVAAECDRNLSEIGHDVEHAAVVMAEQSEAVFSERFLHPGGCDPFVDFRPDRFDRPSTPVTW